MQDIRDDVIVKASVEKVWQAIEDSTAHATWHPFLTHIVGEHVLGAVRKCDVLVGKKPGTTEERCSTYDKGRTIMWTIEQDSTGFSRMASDWNSGFTVESHGSGGTRVVARSLFAPKTLLARLMLPMIRSKFHRTQQSILGGLKHYVEE